MSERMDFDLVLEGAQVYDGGGGKPFVADVGIAGDQITAVGDLRAARADRRLSLKGRALSPGFIDVHSHIDLVAHRADAAALLEPMVRQGITTAVGGNCGVSLAPIAEKHVELLKVFMSFFTGDALQGRSLFRSMASFLRTIESQKLLLNLGMLAPHNLLRVRALDNQHVRADSADLGHMGKELEACLDAGCLGMSTGLMYYPSVQAEQGELQSLGRILRQKRKILAAHLRSYCSDTVAQSCEEVLQVARDNDIHVQLSHLFWVPNFGRFWNRMLSGVVRGLSRLYRRMPFPLPKRSPLESTLAKFVSMNRQGISVGGDSVPSSAGFSILLAFLPPWTWEGSLPEIKTRLADPQVRSAIRRAIEDTRPIWPHRRGDAWSMNYLNMLGYEGVRIMSVVSARNKPLEGQTIAALAAQQGKHPIDAICDLLVEEDCRVIALLSPTQPGDFFIEESNRGILCHPEVSIASDMLVSGQGMPSHLYRDCFPRFLGLYSRAKNWLPLSEAIRKCTSLPARQLGIKLRGLIKPGFFADLVAFDPATIGTSSPTPNSLPRPTGIEMVLINGQILLDDLGFHSDHRPGRLLVA